MKKDLKKSATDIAKLNGKINKQDTLVNKYFGVENEMISLRSNILVKEAEISRLNSVIRK